VTTDRGGRWGGNRRVLTLLMALGGGCRTTPGPTPATPVEPPVATQADQTPRQSIAPGGGASTPVSDDGLGRPAGKRVGPAEVSPVVLGGKTFRVVHWGKERGLDQNGGYVEAIAANGGSLWVVKVYAVTYEGPMEEDVQDVFITALSPGPEPDSLAVTDERGGEYLVDTRTRRVRVVRPRAK
jgi:hypothetical protein